MDKHCKGCLCHHSAGRSKPDNDMKKYNDWCCAVGREASKSIGHCKTHNLRVVTKPQEDAR